MKDMFPSKQGMKCKKGEKREYIGIPSDDLVVFFFFTVLVRSGRFWLDAPFKEL